MIFGGEKYLIETSAARALFYRLYGAPSMGDKIRAAYVFRVLRPLLNLQGGTPTILDAGCGDGFYSLYLARTAPYLSVHAVDIDRDRVQRAQQIGLRLGLKNLHFTTKSLLDLADENKYDLIVCVDVLEHIEQDSEVLSRLAVALKPGAKLVIHVPQSDQRHLLEPGRDWRRYGHVREGYSLDNLKILLQEVGLEALDNRHSFGAFGALSADLDEYFCGFKPLWLLILPVILGLAWLDVHVPNWRGNGLLVVAGKPAVAMDQA